jgi:hypothetical protein
VSYEPQPQYKNEGNRYPSNGYDDRYDDDDDDDDPVYNDAPSGGPED